MSSERLRLASALLLSGACLLSYANGLTGTFTYDDKAIVRDNPRIHSPQRIDEIFTTQYFGGPRGRGSAYRPLLLLSYAIQWWIHGASVVPFHVVNVLFHVAATLLLAKLLLRIGVTPPISVGAALLLAVHPIHVEAVTSLVGRGETQAAALALGSILLALRSADAGRRRWLALALSLVLYLSASLTKESAAVTPALAFLCFAWSAQGDLAARLRAALRRGLAYGVGCVVVLAGVFALRSQVLGGPLKASSTGIFELENPLAPLPPPSRVANAVIVFWRYLGRLALPLRLSSDESAWSMRLVTPREPLAWAAAILLAVVTVAAVLRLSRRNPAALGFLFLFLAAFPASNGLFPTGTVFAERLAYLPSAGFCVIAASWLLGGAGQFASVAAWRAGLLAAVALLMACRTAVRNPVWESDETLFADMVRVSPRSAKAHYDFAYMSAEIGKPRRALEHYARATEIYPGYWDAWAGRGRMERTLGNPAAAEKAYAESVRVAPSYENGYFGLGLAREDRADWTGAERAYREGLKRNRKSAPLAYRLALRLTARRRPEAVFAWRQTLAIAPTSLPVRLGYAEWLRDAGRKDEAVRQVKETLRRSPRHAPALRLLADLES